MAEGIQPSDALRRSFVYRQLTAAGASFADVVELSSFHVGSPSSLVSSPKSAIGTSAKRRPRRPPWGLQRSLYRARSSS